jgi:hypothetical protein
MAVVAGVDPPAAAARPSPLIGTEELAGISSYQTLSADKK